MSNGTGPRSTSAPAAPLAPLEICGHVYLYVPPACALMRVYPARAARSSTRAIRSLTCLQEGSNVQDENEESAAYWGTNDKVSNSSPNVDYTHRVQYSLRPHTRTRTKRPRHRPRYVSTYVPSRLTLTSCSRRRRSGLRPTRARLRLPRPPTFTTPLARHPPSPSLRPSPSPSPGPRTRPLLSLTSLRPLTSRILLTRTTRMTRRL